MLCVVYCNLDKDVLFSVPKSLVCNDEIKLKKPAFNLAFLCCLCSGLPAREATSLVTMTHFQRCPRIATANERHANLQAFFSSLKKILKAGNDGWKKRSHFLGGNWNLQQREKFTHLASLVYKKRESIRYLLRILSSEDVLQLGYFKNASVVDKRAFQASSLLV